MIVRALTTAILLAGLLLHGGNAWAYPREPFTAVVVKVLDGDTADLMASDGELIRVRFFGVDSPEIGHSRCPSEKRLGLIARSFVKNLAPVGSSLTITPSKARDRYQRLIGSLRTVDGKDLSSELLRMGLAVPYYGKGKRRSWCQDAS